MMSATTITKILPVHGKRLHSLFTSALETDFGYFAPEYRKTVERDNSRLKLTLGTIHPKRLFLGLFSQGKLVGYSLSGLEGNNQAFLYWLFVTPSLRKQKLGLQLLDTTESHMLKRSVDSIHLVTHNQEQFYKRNGYRHKEVLSNMSPGVEMFIMEKQLS